jgi:hypothetical protein
MSSRSFHDLKIVRTLALFLQLLNFMLEIELNLAVGSLRVTIASTTTAPAKIAVDKAVVAADCLTSTIPASESLKEVVSSLGKLVDMADTFSQVSAPIQLHSYHIDFQYPQRFIPT